MKTPTDEELRKYINHEGVRNVLEGLDSCPHNVFGSQGTGNCPGRRSICYELFGTYLRIPSNGRKDCYCPCCNGQNGNRIVREAETRLRKLIMEKN